MSEYLGWRDRVPLSRSQSASLKEPTVYGGPVTHSYENYVKNIFHPMNRLKKDKAQMAADHGLSASSMLHMERSLGRYAIDDSLDNFEDNHSFLKTPLEELYSELGLRSPEHEHYRQFPVYIPKQSSEYFAISHGAERRPDRYSVPYFQVPGAIPPIARKMTKNTPRTITKPLIDYKNFDRFDSPHIQISRLGTPQVACTHDLLTNNI
ncbi:hypothetical protein COOONC_14370 [Cooperia oncophora]